MTPDTIVTREGLVEWVAKGARPKYLFFWSHEPNGVPALGKHCLSQWFQAKFEVDGTTYPTAEHFMMAEKARLFADVDAERRILATGHPGAVKRIGRSIARFDEAAWSSARMGIVVRGNMEKFRQNAELASFLVGTRDRVLVEASPVDRIWGIGLAEDDDRARDPARWRGLNLLGFALMQVRSRLSGG